LGLRTFDWLGNQYLWTALLRRLTGVDAEYDLTVIKSFADAAGIPVRQVVAKLKQQTMYRGNRTIN